MKSPLAAWRSGVRWPMVLISVLVAVVALVLVCEAIGWPFLAGPVQRRLAQLLDRRVEFGSDPAKSSGVRIRLLGSVRVRADSIEIGAPSWSPAPHMLLARDAKLSLGYLDLWRAYKGATLHIRDLEAGELDAILQRAAGRRAPRGSSARPRRRTPRRKKRRCRPSAASRVGDGQCSTSTRSCRPASTRASRSATAARAQPRRRGGRAIPRRASDAPTSAVAAASGAASRGIFIRAGGAAASASAAAAERAPRARRERPRLKATGQYRQLPVRIDLRTAGVLGFLAEGARSARRSRCRCARSSAAPKSRFDGSTHRSPCTSPA